MPLNTYILYAINAFTVIHIWIKTSAQCHNYYYKTCWLNVIWNMLLTHLSGLWRLPCSQRNHGPAQRRLQWVNTLHITDCTANVLWQPEDQSIQIHFPLTSKYFYSNQLNEFVLLVELNIHVSFHVPVCVCVCWEKISSTLYILFYSFWFFQVLFCLSTLESESQTTMPSQTWPCTTTSK